MSSRGVSVRPSRDGRAGGSARRVGGGATRLDEAGLGGSGVIALTTLLVVVVGRCEAAEFRQESLDYPQPLGCTGAHGQALSLTGVWFVMRVATFNELLS